MSRIPSSNPALSSEQEAANNLVEQGRITGSYGVRGWVKVEPFNAESQLLLESPRWWVRPNPEAPLQVWQVVQARAHGSGLVAQIEHLQQREEAAAFKGARVLLARTEFPAPDSDEYYWVDLLHCRVLGEDDAGQAVELGRVVHVSDNGAHAVLHVAPESNATSLAPGASVRLTGREHLVPFVAAHVLDVDLEQRTILTNWPESF